MHASVKQHNQILTKVSWIHFSNPKILIEASSRAEKNLKKLSLALRSQKFALEAITALDALAQVEEASVARSWALNKIIVFNTFDDNHSVV